MLIYAALNPVTNVIQSRIDQFNEAHEDVQIEVRDYSGEGGTQRLLVELAAGRVPDIMELHQFGEAGETFAYGSAERFNSEENGVWLPYRRLAQKGYLEDLWPYIENDPDLGREGVMNAPLKAAEVEGGLYMLFRDFFVMTLVGAADVVGDRCGWTFEEMMKTFSTMPDGATLLKYTFTKRDVFNNLFAFGLDQYTDWEHGESNFDSVGFRSMLSFLEAFPTEFDTNLTEQEVKREATLRILDGYQMLDAENVQTLRFAYTFYGHQPAYVGYPTVDGSVGSLFCANGNKLAMSAVCRNKEAAWEFLRWTIVKQFNARSMERARREATVSFPVNRADYELANRVDVAMDPNVIPPFTVIDNNPLRVDFTPTEEDIRRLDTLIDSTTQFYWPNDALADIVWDAIGPYFAGDKTMDETVELLNRRVRLYINEQK